MRGMSCADGGICTGGGSGRGWEVGRLSGRGHFVAVREDIFGCGCMEVGRWSVAVEDGCNKRRVSVAV